MNRKSKVLEINAERILSPTSITIADYVINPYRGCLFGCSYCYAKRNKNIQARDCLWGSFVDVKVNLEEKLRQELDNIDKPINRILISSITESWQPVEKKYGLARKVLEICHEHSIPVTILTKSDLIVQDIDILEKNPENEICFTISPLPEKYLKDFELNSPCNSKRKKAILKLRKHNINVYAHIGPLMPGLIDIDYDMKDYVNRIDFEIFNYITMDGAAIKTIYEKIGFLDLFSRVYSSKEKYELYWHKLKKEIDEKLGDFPHKIHIHPYDNCFANIKGQYEI